jgi:triosephosphate isomerase
MSELGPADIRQVIIAYEPVWAIGERGTPPSVEQIAPVMALISDVVSTTGGPAHAVLYGGSVDTQNAGELLRVPHTDGLFVGRAAWAASGFIELLKLCAHLGRTGPPRQAPHYLSSE